MSSIEEAFVWCKINKQGVEGTMLPEDDIESNVLSKYLGLYELKMTRGTNGAWKFCGKTTSNCWGHVCPRWPKSTGIANHSWTRTTTRNIIVFLNERHLNNRLRKRDKAMRKYPVWFPTVYRKIAMIPEAKSILNHRSSMYGPAGLTCQRRSHSCITFSTRFVSHLSQINWFSIPF